MPLKHQWVSCHLSTVRKQENYENTHWETDPRVQPLVASLDEAKSRWRGTAWNPLSVRVSWEGLQHQFSSSSYVLRLKCPSAAHTSCPQTWVCAGRWWLHKPHHQQSVRLEFIPTCPSHPETTKIIPWITTLGGYIWSVHSWIFTISEYLTAIHRELLRDLSSQQAAIHSTLVEPPPRVR